MAMNLWYTGKVICCIRSSNRYRYRAVPFFAVRQLWKGSSLGISPSHLSVLMQQASDLKGVRINITAAQKQTSRRYLIISDWTSFPTPDDRSFLNRICSFRQCPMINADRSVSVAEYQCNYKADEKASVLCFDPEVTLSWRFTESGLNWRMTSVANWSSKKWLASAWSRSVRAAS